MCALFGITKKFNVIYSLLVVHFWATWSDPCKQMNDVLIELAGEYENVKFMKVYIFVSTISFQYHFTCVG